MTPRKPDDCSWDDFVEKQIIDAQESGAFDNLPGFGRPIAELDQPHDPQWWIKRKLKKERISALPPSLEIKLDVAKTRRQIRYCHSALEVRRMLHKLNERIRQSNYRSVWGPASSTLPLDVEATVRGWAERNPSPND